MRHSRLGSVIGSILLAGWVHASDLPDAASKREFRNWKNPWKTTLEKKGYIDSSVSKPYRNAIPLTTLGHQDAQLMLTYGKTPTESGNKGMLLFVKVKLN